MKTLPIQTMKHYWSEARQGEVQEDKGAVEELVEEAEDLGEEYEKQNAVEVGKELQVEEEGLGVEAGVEAEAEGEAEGEVTVILSKKLVKSSNWSIMNNSYRYVSKMNYTISNSK